MEETKNTPTIREREGFSVPEDFNPYVWADVVKGAVESLHYFLTEGPGIESPTPAGTLASMEGLAFAAMKAQRELHAWLYQVENLTYLRLPRSNEDFDEYWAEHQRADGVKEPPALYAVN